MEAERSSRRATSLIANFSGVCAWSVNGEIRLSRFMALRIKKPGHSRAKALAVQMEEDLRTRGDHVLRRFSRVRKYMAIFPMVSVRPNLVLRERMRLRVFG